MGHNFCTKQVFTITWNSNIPVYPIFCLAILVVILPAWRQKILWTSWFHRKTCLLRLGGNLIFSSLTYFWWGNWGKEWQPWSVCVTIILKSGVPAPISVFCSVTQVALRRDTSLHLFFSTVLSRLSCFSLWLPPFLSNRYSSWADFLKKILQNLNSS